MRNLIITKNRPEERHYPHTIDADKIEIYRLLRMEARLTPFGQLTEIGLGSQDLAVFIITKNHPEER